MKEIREQIKKCNRKYILVACIHWVISFFTDQLIFQYVIWDSSDFIGMAKTIITYGCKLVFLFFLIGLWQGIFYLVKKADRRLVHFAFLYLAVNLILLFLVWPGIWRIDEFGILSSSLKLQPIFWQNYLTSIFYVLSLMLFPFPSGVILTQIMVNSLIVGYILAKVEKMLPRKKMVYLGYLPFLLLPVLDSNLYPIRMSVYGFLELLLIFQLYLRSKSQGKEKWGICILAAIVTVWRTEAIYYIVAMPVLVLVLFHRKWSGKEKLNVILTYVALTIVLFLPQQVGNKLLSGNEYDLTSVVLPVVPLVEEASKHSQSAALLQEIDRVLNVEVTLQGAVEGRNGISLYWSEPAFKRANYTDTDYSAFKQAYYQLILKYPKVFFDERLDSFLTSTGLLGNTTELFTAVDVPNYETFQTYPLSQPWNDNIRTCVIKILEWRSGQDYDTEKTGYGLVYSAIPSMLILLFAILALGIQRKWSLALLLAVPLCKVVLIFLTAPSRLFMYYYSVYLIGYAVLFFALILWIGRKGRNE